MELKSQKNHQTASELFLSLQIIYKTWDYRCLAPDTHDCPTLWGTYDMHNFRYFMELLLSGAAHSHLSHAGTVQVSLGTAVT